MKRIRVAHVITRLCKGGAQQNTFHTVRLANRERYEVDLISGPTSPNEASIEADIASAGIDIIRVPALTRNMSPWRDWRALRTLTNLFREKRYDIVHTHTSKAGYVGRIAAHRAGVPIVVHTPHGHIFHGYFSAPLTRFFVLLERRAARYSDRIIALTERGIEEHLAKRVGTRAQYVAIHSGIDLSPFDDAITARNETRDALGFSPNEIVVGAAGRLEPVKGFTYLVQAACALRESHPQLRFLLAGDGPFMAALREEARDLGDRFVFLGMRDDVPRMMAALDLFVLPSLNEGMGRVLLEAGAAGLPSIASAVGGVPDVIDDGVTGLLVPPRDAHRLADTIVRFADNTSERLRMGAAARAKIVPGYGLDAMLRQIESLYETLIEEKRL